MAILKQRKVSQGYLIDGDAPAALIYRRNVRSFINAIKVNVFNADWHTNFRNKFELPKILANLFSNLIIKMKKLCSVIIVALFAIACKNDGSKTYFDAGIKKMYASEDSAQRIANYKSALADFDKAIEINPKYVDAYMNRANIKNELGDYEGFLQECKKANEIDPNNTNVYRYLSHIKKTHGDINGALTAINKALSIDAKLSTAYADRAEIESDQKNYKAALADYNSAIENTSDKELLKYLHSNRGLTQLDLGNRNNACEDFHKAQELGNPNAKGEIDSYCK